MNAEILMVGTELLLGQIQDTNATFIARELADHGIGLFWKTTVGDNRSRICTALETALSRADVVLCSGGLGPTEDDITRDCLAEVMGAPLVYHEELWEAILTRFARSGRSVTENNKRQATVPEGAEAIPNPNGTAPGLWAALGGKVVACMPGVPFELKPMLTDTILPRIHSHFGVSGVLRYRSLKVCGMGESRVDALMGDLINRYSNPTIGLLAGPEGVLIRIAARADRAEAAEALMDPVEAEIQSRLGGLAFGRHDDRVETEVDRLLRERGWRLAVLETMSAGAVAQRLLAAGGGAFGGGTVLPRAEIAGWAGSPEGVDFEREGVDVSDRLLIDFPFACTLVLLATPDGTATRGWFSCPAGRHGFTLGHYGDGLLQQARLAVSALEQVRRFLMGLPLDI